MHIAKREWKAAWLARISALGLPPAQQCFRDQSGIWVNRGVLALLPTNLDQLRKGCWCMWQALS